MGLGQDRFKAMLKRACGAATPCPGTRPPPEGTWSEDAEGTGCTYLEDSVDEFVRGAGREAVWEGTFTGNLSNLTILAHRSPTDRDSIRGRIGILVVVDDRGC